MFLGALAIAVSQLGIAALDNFLQAIAAYLPNVVVAILIFVVAGVVARLPAGSPAPSATPRPADGVGAPILILASPRSWSSTSSGSPRTS